LRVKDWLPPIVGRRGIRRKNVQLLLPVPSSASSSAFSEERAVGDERFFRQSFLGKHSQAAIERAVIGVVGLGGSGGHVAQQLAPIGFLNYRLFDRDGADVANLNCQVIATEADTEGRQCDPTRGPRRPRCNTRAGYG
jgi:hypothetical protein